MRCTVPGPHTLTAGLVYAGRENLSLHLGLGRRDDRVGLPKPRLWPSTVPGAGPPGGGAQSPGQSHLVLSQASGARHLRGSDRRAWGPALRHQKARELWQEAGDPKLEYGPEWAGRGRTQPRLQQTGQEKG